MKSLFFVLSIVLILSLCSQPAGANMINGHNWADDVVAYSTKIQNYGGTSMSVGPTTWWLTGEPDADDDHDYVGGWRGDAQNEYVIMHWTTPMFDQAGDDLMIRLRSGSAAGANVLASVDGESYLSIGTLGAGDTETFRMETFDFAGQFTGDISYIKVERTANKNNTGMFFDAFGSVPEPSSVLLLVLGAALLALIPRRSGKTHVEDSSY